MSKFIEKIKRTLNRAPVPMGFNKKPSEEEQIPPMLLIADITGATQKRIKEMVESGIDAVIATGDLSDTVRKIVKDLSYGCIIDDSSVAGEDKINADSDFAIFDINTNISLVDREELGRVLSVDRSLTPAMIKPINDLNLNIDAILINDIKERINIDSLILCHLYKDILNKPVLIKVMDGLSVSELSELNFAGVRGLILSREVTSSQIKELLKNIKNLPRSDKKKSAVRPLIPTLNTSQLEEKEEVEQEEEDIE